MTKRPACGQLMFWSLLLSTGLYKIFCWRENYLSSYFENMRRNGSFHSAVSITKWFYNIIIGKKNLQQCFHICFEGSSTAQKLLLRWGTYCHKDLIPLWKYKKMIKVGLPDDWWSQDVSPQKGPPRRRGRWSGTWWILDRFTKTFFFWNFQKSQAVLCYILMDKQMLH